MCRVDRLTTFHSTEVIATKALSFERACVPTFGAVIGALLAIDDCRGYCDGSVVVWGGSGHGEDEGGEHDANEKGF